MKSVFSWLISSLVVVFWIFRIVVALFATFEVEFMATPSDINLEIALIFLTLPCIVMIFKRKVLGGIVHFGLYAWYFGTELVMIMQNILENNTEVVSTSITINVIFACTAILISLANLLDLFFARHRKSENPSKRVDWFYKNEDYDRKIDERSDKNNYRIY